MTPRTWRPPTIDIALGVAITALAVFVRLAAENGDPGSAAWVALAPLIGLPVAYRRVAPRLASVGLLAAIALTALPNLDVTRCGAVVPVLMLLAFTGAARLELAGALQSLALLLAGVLILSFTDPQLDGWGGVAFVGALTLFAWISGRVARSLGVLGSQLQERTRLLEQERGHTARLATEIERRRVGARLDTAARAELDRMIELSRAGEAAADDDPERAAALFAEIERTSRATLDEIRGVLGSLRQDGATERGSTPTLAELESLVGEARATGRAVRLDVEGEPPALSAGVELSLYRLLQHALYAFGEATPLTVRLRYRPDRLELEVEGASTESMESAEAVHAARERASVHGGSLRVLAGEAGSVVLSALLPVAGPRAAVS